VNISDLDWSLPLCGLAGASLLMFLAWLWHLRARNAGIVDVGWALGIGGLALYYGIAGSGDPSRRGVVAALAGVWALRLASHLFFRSFWKQPEEGRYVRLRQALGDHVAAKFLLFFLAQALLDVLLSMPFLVAAASRAPLDFLDFFGVFVVFGAWAGESVADRQLARFKRRNESKGKTCREGLWRYSRHPNYFFEWLVWCGFALIATRGDAFYLAWTAPALMYLFLTRITGIPPAEAQSVKNRSDYRDYQATTSAFFPWFPKEQNG
jgi:steroid 5-alpha reductase family enzyme